MSQGCPILTPAEIRANLNAYGRYNQDDVGIRFQEENKRRFTSSKGNPYKWVSPAYRSMNQSRRPEATVTSSSSTRMRSFFNTIHTTTSSVSDLRDPPTLAQNSRFRLDEAEVTITMGVAHSDHPSTMLTDQQCELIENNLLYEILKCENGKGPKFKGVYIEENVVWFTVANDSSVTWLYETIPHFRLWPRASLKVGRPSEIKGLIRVAASLPKALNEMDESNILQLLKSQNKGLNTEKWNILKRLSDGAGRILIFHIDSESLKVLQGLSFRPFLGLTRVSFKINQ
ncbi:unnamed protein product [Acanthoscelides obtectus]|uniref:DUF4780 domain-containing protein n=1 Tax=Acanthoscelides obtectus TaxID=200917 RepID=A0A9P0M5Y0_ACAOB|nr:unnamed protein product [Acanthoscelides obtectus]CAK1629242.1 hypothetical protein AOBTE_LOCUS5635 [Acanthoscelides obtectus]